MAGKLQRLNTFVCWFAVTGLLAAWLASLSWSSSGESPGQVDEEALWLGQCVSFGQNTAVNTTACEELNRLEEFTSTWWNESGPIMAEYEQALAAWRRLDLAEQPHCRLDWLGVWLQREAVTLPPRETRSLWDAMVEGLQARMLDPIWARCFPAWYVHRRISPEFYGWPETEYTGEADVVLASPDYESTLAAAGHLAPRYGAPQVELKAGGLRAKRAINLLHWHNILGVFPGLHLEGLAQVFEFGGGTGDFQAMLRDLGYTGTHFVYDLPPVLLFTQYWLRYSGVPAYQGWRLPPKPEVARNRTIMEQSVEGDASFARIDTAQLQSSLFVAFESFSESPIEVRQRMAPWIKRFGFVIMSFEAEFDGVSNAAFMEGLQSELAATHDVMVWDSGHGRGGGGPWGSWKYFAAAARGQGGVVCGPQSSCSNEVLYSLTEVTA